MKFLFLLFFLSLTPLRGEEATLHPGDGGYLTVFPAAAGNFDASPVIAGGKPYLRISWSGLRENSFAFQIRPAFQLFRAERVVIDIEVILPDPSRIRSINLQIVDHEGETFQFWGKIPPGSRGKQRLRYVIPAQRHSSWGRNKNNRLDFPATLQGFSVHVEPSVQDGGFELGSCRISFDHL